MFDEPIRELLAHLRKAMGYSNKPFEPETFTSIFVGLYPTRSDAQRIVEAYNLHPSWMDELHVTMVYALTEDNPSEQVTQEIFAELVAQLPRKIKAKLNGITRFSGDEQDALVINVDGVDIERSRLILTSDSRIDTSGSGHGFTPHLTIAYVGHDEPSPFARLPQTLDIEFNMVAVGYASKYNKYFLSQDGVKELSNDDERVDLTVTIDDESGEREALNPKRRRSYNMGHVKEG